MRNIIKTLLSSEEKGLKYSFIEPNRIHTFLNPVSYIDVRKNKQLFSEFDGIFVDGSILIKAIQILYNKRLKRRSFDMTSVAPTLFDYSIKNNKSIYIVGAKEEELKKAINILKHSYPKFNVIGYRNGYFYGQNEKEEEYEKIISTNPDFLIVGMGIIHQERFLVEIKNRGFKGIGFTCGGFISQTAKGKNKIDYYPEWVNKYNIRFLYRMYKEKHTRKRYLKAAFIFPILFIKDRITK